MTLGDARLAVADRFHRFGALVPAAQLYGLVLSERPDNPDVWCRLAAVHHALGESDEAAACYRRALALRPDDPVPWNNLGFVLMGQDRLAEAADCYREALRLRPDYAEAHNNLGIVRLRQGRPEEAVACCGEALRLRPDYAEAHNNLGTAMVSQGQLELALASYGQAVEREPNFAAAWANLGSALRGLGRSEEAGSCYERARTLQPGDPGPLHELGLLRLEQGRSEEAVACFEQALRRQPDSVGICNNLGLALLRQGHASEAELSFRQADYLEPDLARVHNNLGLALLHQGREAEALDRFRRAVHLEPDLADAQNNLGLTLAAQGLTDEALSCYERAVQHEPGHVGALVNLGNAYKDQGRVAEAIAAYRKALALKPDAPVHSNLLLAMQYQPGVEPHDILAESRRYAARHAATLTGPGPPGTFQPLDGRRLRVGYVSPDFREHPVAYFLEPILTTHDHRRFEIFCYADVPRPDAVTERCQKHADHWRSLVGLSDEQAAALIRGDDIDLLIDLAGHTGGNRLLVFARRPATVQATYLGYLGTTGLPAMDYYLTDAHADPPCAAEAHYLEQLIRLPECGFCYRPGPAPAVSPEPPARRSGRVTFGCLNNRAKISEEVLNVWSRLLAAVPDSQLLLRTGAGRLAEERLLDVLTRHGIVPDRLRIANWTPTRWDYLTLYHSVDIGLDPFPYNGVTTTCDALWMGIPVIGLAGRMSVSRQGVRFLRAIGLDELLAETPEDYVRIATALAVDLARLADLRSGLRERMNRSPLMDADRLTRDLETAYVGIWKNRLAARDSING